ncbi:hypothetical protein A4H97_12125 [Niastella yeongjuensis]|uniref:Cytochrome C oxidase subunit I n=1 Tax=Niastella yeongjuensis TaxID=354355 RepID=A0A1V9E9U5_9BACT|nr:hypothetical protein [Niastella yeongjuensis]OQP42893.1 hypothetical protein A4H97_12125 [Niastella yeongjuensis]SEO58485.1 hypothetical protein SAMN05660816_03092 [Niastella yeongjuensis]
MSDLNIGKAPPPKAVIPFYATGALFFVVLCLLLFLSAGDLTGHYFSPHLLAVVHTAVLGWGTMIIFGAGYQLMPVICERDIYSPLLAVISFYALTAGAVLLVISFWFFWVGWPMITGGALVVTAAVLYAVNVYHTSGQCNRQAAKFIVSSAAWLMFTVVVGLLLAINLRFPFIPMNHIDVLKLHAHAGLAGWFLQLITGVSARLVPMFLLGKSAKEPLMKYAFYCQNGGLVLFLADAYFNGISTRGLFYELIIAVGAVAWVLYLADVYKNRVRKKTDWQMKQTGLSFVCLLGAFVVLPLLYGSNDKRWAIVMGTLLFMGWMTGIILGKTFKTLPFIVWNNKFRQLNGKVKVPMPKHLYKEQLVQYQFWCFLIALLLLIAGISLACVVLIRIALVAWIITACLYVYNVGVILFYKIDTNGSSN